MSKEDIPEKVLHFINERIDSVELLQVLLLLHSNPARIWTISDITSELRSANSSIIKRLEDLYSRKVLVRELAEKDQHRFSPSSDEVKSVIDQLAQENQLRPYRVIEAIYSKPAKSLRAFADAFNLRGDKT